MFKPRTLPPGPLNVKCEVIVAVSSRVALPITCPDFAGILLDLVKCWPVPISNY